MGSISCLDRTGKLPYHRPVTFNMEGVRAQSTWRRAARRVARRAISWRFRRFNPRTHGGRMVRVAGLELWVGKGVFDPSLHFTSSFMANYLKGPTALRSAQRILDVGTGTGVLAIAAAHAGSNRVIATDVNPAAVACARANVQRQGLGSRIEVEQGEFVPQSLNVHFDLVVCNPPYFRGNPQNHAQAAYMGGADLEWFDRFTNSVKPHLTFRGRALLVLSDAADLPAILKRLNAGGWAYRVVARRDIIIEVMYIVEIVPVNP